MKITLQRPSTRAALAFASLVATLLSTSAHAAEGQLVADTFVNTGQPANNFGALPTFNVGGGSTALLRFDLSTLPAGATPGSLARASLVLFVNRIGASGAIEVQTVLGGWNEAGVTQATAPRTAGSGSGPTVPVSSAGQYLIVDVTAQVAGWIATPSSNFGFALAPAVSSPATVVFFDATENTGTGHVARLVLTLNGSGSAGPTGPTGARGPTGPTGATGAGAPGPQARPAQTILL